MTTEKTSFQIALHYDETSASTAEMQALADELTRRGHSVSLQCRKGSGGLFQQAKDIAANVKDAAGDFVANVGSTAVNVGSKILSTVMDPIGAIGSIGKDSKSGKDGKSESDGSSKSDAPKPEAAFDAIGPDAAAAARASSNRAVVVTNADYVQDADADAIRIGLLPKNVLENGWQPRSLDAMVIPHRAFRPYLEYVHWDASRVFEGGALALDADKPTCSHADAQSRFQVSSEQGPIVVVLASGIPAQDLQTLIIQISLIKMPMQIFFHHNGVSYYAEQLRQLAAQYNVNARMFGHVERLSDYIAMADIAVVSADDAAVQLVENAGVPSVCIASGPTPARVAFLVHENAAIVAPQLFQLSNTLVQPVADAALRDSMTKAAQEIAKLASVSLCADGIEAALAQKDAIVPPQGRKVVVQDGFEVIGAQAPSANILTPQLAAPTPTPAIPFENVAPAASYAAPAPFAPPMAAPFAPPMAAPYAPQASFAPAPGPMLMPNLTPRSREELHSEYTRLVMTEKNIEKSLRVASDSVRLWESRLDLARQNNRDDLANSAIAALTNAKNQEMALFQQREQILQEKETLRQSARLIGAQQNSHDMRITKAMIDDELFGDVAREDSKLESEFRNLQKIDALNRLKNDMGRR